jgi:ribosomal protein S18 acetylase RimI-like enzyme
MMNLNTKLVTVEDNILALVEAINAVSWDDDNEMCAYNEEDLRFYLEQQHTVFVACYSEMTHGKTLVGIASARIEIKPYEKERWLYVDELDVCTDQRRKGVGKFMMQFLIDFAQEQGCDELWLGAEADNLPANALYRSLKPDDVGNVVGYTFETDS